MLNLVKRCIRNQLIFLSAGLVMLAGLALGVPRVISPHALSEPTAPAAGRTQPNSLTPPSPTSVKRIERRKRAITRYLAAKYKQHPKVVRRYVDLAWHESLKNPSVEPELILAVMLKESRLDAKAENSYGAKGLMQVVPRWHPEKVSDNESLLDPKVNIRVGTKILQQYIQEKGRVDKALNKYSGNATGYVAFVLRAKEELQSMS